MKRWVVWLLPLVGLAAVVWLVLPGDDRSGSAPPLDVGTERDAAEEEAARLQGRAVEHTAVARAATGFVLRGLVVDEEDRPVGGVTVVARPGDRRDARNEARGFLERAFSGRPPPPAPVETTTSAGDGTFAFHRLAPGEVWEVEARPAPPGVGAQRTVRIDRTPGLPPEVRLRVWKGSALRVRVVDAAGAGLRGFVAARGPWLGSVTGSFYQPETPTDADGRVTLPAVPPPAVGLAVRVPDRVLVRAVTVHTPADEEVVVRIGDPDDAGVRGRVQDTSGGPVVGAQVLVTVVPEPRYSWRQRRTEAMALTDAAGSYEVRGLPAGHLESVAASARGCCARTQRRGHEKLEAGGTAVVDMVLLRGAVLHGRVLGPEGQPIAGAKVSVAPAGGGVENPFLEEATSERDGAYRVEPLPPGALFVAAHAEGWCLPATIARHRFSRAQSGVAVTIDEEGAVVRRDLEMRRGTPVEGRVVGASGEGVGGAVVTASGTPTRPMGGVVRPPVPRATSGEDGRFSFTGLAPAPDWTFQARVGDLCSGWSPPVTLREGAREAATVELVVRPSATLGGRVLDAADQPVKGVDVYLQPRHAAEPTSTDASGRFLFRGLPADTYTLQTVRSLAPTLRATPVERTLAWGAVVDDVVLRVPVAERVAGVLVDTEGEPVAGQVLWLRSLDERTYFGHFIAVTDASGAFEIPGVASGRYRVVVGEITLDTEVEAGDADVRLVLAEDARVVLEGTVLDPDGRPVPSGRLMVSRVEPGGGRSGRDVPITVGRFRAELPREPGTIDIEVDVVRDVAGRRLNTRPLHLRDVDPAGGPIEIRLEEGLVLEGRVVDVEGRGVEGVRVTAAPVGRRAPRPLREGGAVTAADGRFCLVGLGEEEVALHAVPPRIYAPPPSLRVRPGTTDVVIRLEAGSALTGRVEGPAGEAVPGAHVRAYWRGEDGASQHREATTGTDGIFRLEGLGREAVHLSVDRGPGQPNRRWPYVPVQRRDVDPASKDLVIRLARGVWIEGIVVGPDGRPARLGVVSARGQGGGPRSTSESGSVNPDGTFAIGPIPAGPYVVTASPGEPAMRASEERVLDAPASGVRLVLREAYTIEGRVRGEDTAGFLVNLIQTAGPATAHPTIVRTTSEGRFTFGGLMDTVEGTLFARRSGDDRYALRRGVRADGGPYDLALRTGRTIAGRLEGDLPEGDELRGGVTARGPYGIRVQTQLRGTRTFELRGLPPGAWRLEAHVWGSGRHVRFEPVENVEAGTLNVVLRTQ